MNAVEVTWASTWASIRADAARYPNCFDAPGWWVSLSYRVRRLRKVGRAPWRLLLVLDLILGMARRVISDTTISAVVEIGPGLFLPHPQGIIINAMSRIGSGVTIFQQVTLGQWRGSAPIICDGVSIYSGAKVFGKVTVGYNSKIGANAVVSRDIPDFSTVSVPMPDVTSDRVREAPENA